MNAIVPLQARGVPAAFQGVNLPDMNTAAQTGLVGSFAVVGYKGRVWSIKYHGEAENLVDPDTRAPLATIDVVIVGISPSISKKWYDKRFSEGDKEAPDCFSVNGITPDTTSSKPQHTHCATCPQNVFGSRVTEAGKKAKACQDARRIAVVSADDIENLPYGGPMMLSVPAMSLAPLEKYTREIGRLGAQPYMVRTTLGFDYDVAYPLIAFKAAGWMDSADEGEAIIRAVHDPLVQRMLEVAPESEVSGADTGTSALAGGPPAVYAQSANLANAAVEAAALLAARQQAEAEAARVAAAAAAAVAAAAQAAAAKAALAKAQAPAPVAQPAATNAAAPAVKKGFGAKRVAAPAAIPTQQIAAPQPAPATVAEVAQAQPTAQTVQPAPEDLESAIEALLG